MFEPAGGPRLRGSGGAFGPRAEPRQPPIVVVARAAEGHPEALRDVLQTHLLQARELQRRPLPLGQLREACSNDPAALLPRQAVPVPWNRQLDPFERLAAVRRSSAERLLAPQAAMIGVLQEPHAHGAARGIVKVRFSVDLEKDLLRDVLGFPFIPQNADRHAVDQSNVSLEQGAQRVTAGQVHLRDQVRVRLPAAACSVAPIDPLFHRRPPRWSHTLYRRYVYHNITAIDGSRARNSAVHKGVPRRKVIVRKPQPRPAILRPLGGQLRRLRLERNLSQERLAEKAGLNYKHIGRIELAKSEPGADVLVRLAVALEIPVGEIFATITPTDATPHRLSPADVEALSTALAALTAAANRIVARQPNTLPARAPRRPRR
jgi:transcriptional regulator with XRE-family HTH domain